MSWIGGRGIALTRGTGGGVALGLVGGKLLGIVGGAWVGLRLRVAVLPGDLHWRQLAGAAALGGIGFTVSLFVTGLAFTDPQLQDAAKLAILAASLTAAVAGAAVLLLQRPPPQGDTTGLEQVE
jgi:NhaA family Na+:H+ antiporter